MTDGAEDASARPAETPVAARARRLRRRPDFLAAAGGKRFHTERMSAQARLREPDEMRDGATADGLYLGFTITKRVGHATERNRIRRRLRRAAELAAGDVAARAADVVVIARRPALSAPFETLVDDLRRALGVVTKLRGPKSASGDAPSGGRERESAHVRHRGKSGKPPEPHASTTMPHGSTDG